MFNIERFQSTMSQANLSDTGGLLTNFLALPQKETRYGATDAPQRA
jgi:hypothetical protein